MIDNIKNLADNVLGIRQDLSDPKNPDIKCVAFGPIDKLQSFGPIPLNASKLAKFLLNDLRALEKKLKIPMSEMYDPKKLALLFGLSELGWFSRKDLLLYLEYEQTIKCNGTKGSSNDISILDD